MIIVTVMATMTMTSTVMATITMMANDFDDDDGDGDFARKTKHPSTLAMPGSASAVGVKPTGVFVNAILCHFCTMEDPTVTATCYPCST